MPNFSIVVRKERGGLVMDDGAIELVAGECANGVQRLPPRDHDELDLAVALALEQAHTAVARDRDELGHDDAAEMLGVFNRAFARRASGPDALDHEGAFLSASPPTTTVHGRTRQLVASPSRTYGSARAKSSAIDADSPRNTSSAPS